MSALTPRFDRKSHPVLAVAIACAALLVSLGTIGQKDFLPALLGAFVFWLQISLGCLGILLIHDVTGGKWGIIINPFLRWSQPTLYVLAIMFTLIALFSGSIYSFSTRASFEFFFRGAICFALWISISHGFAIKKRVGRPTKAWSGGSLLILLFTITFASMDWLMTLSPDWTSTGFGVIFIAGSLCAGFSFVTLMTLLKEERIATGTPKKSLLIDLGNLVLMSIMFWAYVDFMQYLIMWSGQLPKETRWYAERSIHGWSAVIGVTAVLNFALPMAALLFRGFKRKPRLMFPLCVSILVGRLLESLLWTAPARHLDALTGLGYGALAFAFIGMLWLAVYANGLRREPLATYRRIAIEVNDG